MGRAETVVKERGRIVRRRAVSCISTLFWFAGLLGWLVGWLVLMLMLILILVGVDAMYDVWC